MDQLPFSSADVARICADLIAAPSRLMIGGRMLPAVSGRTFESQNPATGELLGLAAAGAAADIDRAVEAARVALEGDWSRVPPAERARLLLRLSELIEADATRLAILETLDNGMPFFLARFGSVGGAVEQLRYNAGWATKLSGETITPSSPGEYHVFTRREPVGVVGGIVPWNMPFVMAVSKLAPALAAGCTIILKPAEQTPFTALRLAELALEAGFPAGTINVVTGLGIEAGAALAAHPGVDKVSFTGSTQVGRAIIRASAGDLKRVSLELGGKSPVFLFGDAEVEKAIPAIAAGIFLNSGQVCAAGSRLYVHEHVFDQVIEGIVAYAANMKIGPGLAAGTRLGPLISEKQRERVLSYIEGGVADGAQLVTGGECADGPGFFVRPTVLTGTVKGMKVVDEEIFGPVLCAMRFAHDDLDVLARHANASDYGLSSSIWTRDISTAFKLASRIKAGTVRVNGGTPGVDPAIPMGGFKQSGWGRENGRVGIDAYTEIKTVSIAL